MNFIVILLTLCAALCIPFTGHADDKLVSVDLMNDLITVDQRGSLRSFKAKKFTEITLNGVKANIDQLRPGMMVRFVLSDPQTVSKIAARGNPGQGATIAPAAAEVPLGTTKRIVIKLYVDGSDVITIGGGRLWIKHVSAKKPTGISINGIKWEPTWKGDTSESFTGFTPALAPFASGKVSVKQTDGRGETIVVEPPTKENQQTLSFRIQDGGRGGDVHEIRVTW